MVEDNLKKPKLGVEPAFPSSNDAIIGKQIQCNTNPEGMSKRFYAACAAMQGLLANRNLVDLTIIINESKLRRSNIIKASYEFADELLRQENESKD